MDGTSSPYATGSGGADFERLVGAYYLATLIARVVPRGFRHGIAQHVKFQRLYEGEPLDDLIVIARDPHQQMKLALQIKRDLVFGERNPTFDAVIYACWQTFIAPNFDPTVDRFGIVLGLYSKRVEEHFQTALNWARMSASTADFYTRVGQPGLSSAELRGFVELISEKLRQFTPYVTDEQIWQFLRCMVLLHYDFQTGGSRDYAHAIYLLTHALATPDATRAAQLFNQLTQIGAEAQRTAGSHDQESLRTLLLHYGYSLAPLPNCLEDLARLRQHADFILADIRTQVGTLTLNRVSTLESVRRAVEENSLIEIVGVPGVGKSAILKSLAESVAGHTQAIVLSGDRITGAGWDSFAAELQLQNPLRTLLLSLSGSPQSVIFIDGADRVLQLGPRRAVNDLLRSVTAMPPHPDGKPRWKVILTAREENLQQLHNWLDIQSFGQPGIVHVEELNDEELKLVVEHAPRLRHLLYSRHVAPVLKAPFILDRLLDQRLLGSGRELPAIATEIEVSTVWWERIVGDDGSPLGRARQQVLLEAGRRRLTHPGRPVSEQDLSTDALVSLEVDRILTRDRDRDVYRFAHDLLEDWVLMRVLDQRRNDLSDYLRELGQPLGLYRPMQLLGSARLEREGTPAVWYEILQQFETSGDLALRWRHALLTAPLASARSQDLLSAVEPILFEDDGKRLIELFVAARTVEVSPDYSLGPVASEFVHDQAELIPFLLSSPVPRWSTWVPLMGWVVERSSELPESAGTELIRLMEMWQEKSPPGAIYRPEVGRIALRLLNEDKQAIQYLHADDDDAVRLLRIVLFSADVLPAEVAGFLDQVRKDRSWDAQRLVMRNYRPLVDYLPEQFADFALDVMIEKPEDDEGLFESPSWLDDDNLGLRDDLEYMPPAHVQGPFLYLLRSNEDQGLRLIQTLANTAVANWRRRVTQPRFARDIVTPLPVVLQLPSGPREFWGDAQVYTWFRPNSNGPYSLISALMALEVWMEEQIEAGRDAEELLDKVLNGSDCLATVGLCLGIALAYPDKCLKAALPIVSAPSVWRLDIPRYTQDLHGTFVFDPLEQHKYINESVKERDQCPQRRREIRNLAMYYMLSAPPELREAFALATRTFTESLPFLWEEERQSPDAAAALREQMEAFQLFGSLEHYRQRQVDGKVGIWVEPPAHIRQRMEAQLTPVNEHLHWFALDDWAQQLLDKGEVLASFTLEAAVQAAQRIQQPEDFTKPYQVGGEHNSLRLQVIAGVAAAIVVKQFEWTQAQQLVAWARDVLMAAAALPSAKDVFSDRFTIFPSDPRRSAAVGLTALVAHGIADDEVREQIIRLVAFAQHQVVEAVFRGLASAWRTEPVLCWNALSLGLHLALVPTRVETRIDREASRGAAEKHQATALARHLIQLRQGVIPTLLRIGDGAKFYLDWHLAPRILAGLPLGELCRGPASKQQLLGLLDDLMQWTITKNTEDPQHPHSASPPYEWNSFFGRWLAELARGLPYEDVQNHILNPIHGAWKTTPRLTVDLLRGYIFQQVGSIERLPQETHRVWREIAAWVLDSDEVRRDVSRRYFDRHVAAALGLLAFVEFGASLLTEKWPHAQEFTDVFSAWIEQVGHHPDCFSQLLTMLNTPGWVLAPEPMLLWLNTILGKVAKPDVFWGEHHNAQRTAKLLQRVWSSFGERLKSDDALIRVYGRLLDELVAAGQPVAARLREELESDTD